MAGILKIWCGSSTQREPFLREVCTLRNMLKFEERGGIIRKIKGLLLPLFGSFNSLAVRPNLSLKVCHANRQF
jgi:hypothetical protein